MADQDILILANPNAGKADGTPLTDLLDGRDRFLLRETEGAGHAEELAAEATEEGWPTVVAAGGDGTINEVLNGLEAGCETTRFGILTLGTGNDFARVLDLPEELDAQLDLLESDATAPCDIGRVSGAGFSRLFLNMSAGGASGEVSNRVDTAIKNFWGPLAYMRAAIETLPMLEPYTLRVRLDSGEEIRDEPLNLIVANGRCIAAGIPVAPRALVDDGFLDVLLFKAEDLAALSALTLRVLAGEHLETESEQVIFRRVRSFELESEPEMPFNTDGERLPAQPERFEALAGVLQLARPTLTAG